MLPLVGERDFGLTSTSTILAFVVAFGLAKAVKNLAAGALADRVGRKRLLMLGWLVALPVPLLVGLAPSWSFIVAANILLGGPHGGLGRRLVIAAVGLFAAIVLVHDTAAHVAVEQRAHATGTVEPLPSADRRGDRAVAQRGPQ